MEENSSVRDVTRMTCESPGPVGHQPDRRNAWSPGEGSELEFQPRVSAKRVYLFFFFFSCTLRHMGS